jgi:hypothetical protein
MSGERSRHEQRSGLKPLLPGMLGLRLSTASTTFVPHRTTLPHPPKYASCVSIGLFVAGLALGLIIGRLWFRRADGDRSDNVDACVERRHIEAARDADASALTAPSDAATAPRESQATQ